MEVDANKAVVTMLRHVDRACPGFAARQKECVADWKVQATLYGISFCVLVDVPKTPKRYGLVNKAGDAQRTFDCAREMHRILSLIQVEFRAYANTLLPDELYEWLLVTCWRYCKRA